jgi:hypothetical protein
MNGQYGKMSAKGIAALILEKGLPPKVAAGSNLIAMLEPNQQSPIL